MGKLDEIMASEDKAVFEANGALSKLFRKILLDLNVTQNRCGILLEQYLNDPKNGIPRNGKERSTARGNITKGLADDDMTWKVFLTNLRVLKPLKVEINVSLHWPRKVITHHSINIVTGDLHANEVKDQVPSRALIPDKEANDGNNRQ